MKTVYKAIIFIVLLFTTSCVQQNNTDIPSHINELENLTVYESDIDRSAHLQFEKEQEFGDSSVQPLGQLWDVTIDRSGMIYIADSQQLNIKVYDPAGQLVSTIGRRGQGPGEFQELSKIHVVGNTLFVVDRNQQRIHLFSTSDQKHEESIRIAENRDEFQELEGTYLSEVFVRNDQAFLVKFSYTTLPENIKDWDKYNGENYFYLLSSDGDISSRQLFQSQSTYEVMISFGGRRTGMPFEFYGKPLTAISKDNRIYHAWSEDFLIKEYETDGEYQQASYYPFEKAPFEIESSFSGASDTFIQEAEKSMEFPDTLPVLNDLLIDDENRIWVSTIVEDFNFYEWWVLEASGELITTLEWPRDEPIEVIKNGKLYTRQTDEETGLERIVRYRVEFEEVE